MGVTIALRSLILLIYTSTHLLTKASLASRLANIDFLLSIAITNKQASTLGFPSTKLGFNRAPEYSFMLSETKSIYWYMDFQLMFSQTNCRRISMALEGDKDLLQ